MRPFSILGGSVLLLLAVGGVICWVMGFEMLREMLVDGVPVFLSRGGSQTQVPGRWVAALILTVPVACAIVGGWLLRAAFDKEEEKH